MTAFKESSSLSNRDALALGRDVSLAVTAFAFLGLLLAFAGVR